LPSYGRLWRLLRRLRPDIVHTRNVGTIDMQWVALASGVAHRVHGEHGWTADDPRGLNRHNLAIRRACRPAIHRYVAMSRDIASWLQRDVGAPSVAVRQIYNGVDTVRFSPQGDLPADFPWAGEARLVIGTVGRLDPVKNQLALLQGFHRILEHRPELRAQLRLIIAGNGPLRAELEDWVRNSGLSELIWMPGAREDVAALIRVMDVFVLPSVNEGISNTILEAMASALPVVAGRVGGNPELVEDGVTGRLYRSDAPDELEEAILGYLDDASLRSSHGLKGRARVVEHFSMTAMVQSYANLYDELTDCRNALVLPGHSHGVRKDPGQTRTTD
jgi:sugar transferase (PEP-CTERM/EpsH1 system associated)